MGSNSLYIVPSGSIVSSSFSLSNASLHVDADYNFQPCTAAYIIDGLFNVGEGFNYVNVAFLYTRKWVFPTLKILKNVN